jgi:hypothetical protein
MPSFFMAITITTINPPATKTAIAWDWQAAQDDDPHAQVALVTLATDLKTGTVGAAGTPDTTPTYTITGVNGLVAAGGAATNGVKLAKLAAGSALTVTGNGTSGATAKTGVATTGGKGTGLTVDLIAAGGVVTGAVVKAPGSGYAVGDVITVAKAVSGTGSDVTLVI